MSSREDADIDRLDAAMRRFYATERRSLRWWKHAREYVSLLRLVRGVLLAAEKPAPPPLVDPALTYRPTDDDVVTARPHPVWDAVGWRWNTPDGKAPYRD